MPKTNTTIYIILGLLDHERLSGYDIKKKIDLMISHFWEVGFGQIYPTLKHLEGEGLIVKESTESSKGPEKNVYAITPSGKAALREWLDIAETREYTRYEILLKLFFGSGLDPEENIRRIRLFKERHQKNMGVMELFKQNLQPIISQDEDHLYYYLTMLFGEEVYKAYLSWADKAESLLRAAELRRQQPRIPEQPAPPTI